MCQTDLSHGNLHQYQGFIESFTNETDDDNVNQPSFCKTTTKVGFKI
jgi:hypothetical protein